LELPVSKKRLMLGIAALMVIAAISYSHRIPRTDAAMRRGFERITEGMTTDQVMDLMGSPDAESAECRDSPSWLDRPVVGKTCALQYRYNAWFGPIFWTVGFDGSRVVIAKYAYVSP
jgi:hypothetical protein